MSKRLFALEEAIQKLNRASERARQNGPTHVFFPAMVDGKEELVMLTPRNGELCVIPEREYAEDEETGR